MEFYYPKYVEYNDNFYILRAIINRWNENDFIKYETLIKTNRSYVSINDNVIRNSRLI